MLWYLFSDNSIITVVAIKFSCKGLNVAQRSPCNPENLPIDRLLFCTSHVEFFMVDTGKSYLSLSEPSYVI